MPQTLIRDIHLECAWMAFAINASFGDPLQRGFLDLLPLAFDEPHQTRMLRLMQLNTKDRRQRRMSAEEAIELRAKWREAPEEAERIWRDVRWQAEASADEAGYDGPAPAGSPFELLLRSWALLAVEGRAVSYPALASSYRDGDRAFSRPEFANEAIDGVARLIGRPLPHGSGQPWTFTDVLHKRTGSEHPVAAAYDAAGVFFVEMAARMRTAWGEPLPAPPVGRKYSEFDLKLETAIERHLLTFPNVRRVGRDRCRQVLGVSPKQFEKVFPKGGPRSPTIAEAMTALALERALPPDPILMTTTINSHTIEIMHGPLPFDAPSGASTAADRYAVVYPGALRRQLDLTDWRGLPWKTLDAVVRASDIEFQGSLEAHCTYIQVARAGDDVLGVRLIGPLPAPSAHTAA